MLARVPICNVQSLDDVARVVGGSERPKVVIFDVDNTLAPQEAAPSEFVALVNSAIDRFESMAEVARVIPLTNGPQRGVDRIVARGNKPWTSRRRLGLRGSRLPVVVVGDQLLTDGLLAWRLGATHLHLVIDDENEDARQATMRRIGNVLAGLFFRSPR